MSSIRSRPSSARSTVDRPGSVPVDRPVAAPRRTSTVEIENFIIECKAAYLAVFDNLKVEIESKQELCKVLQQAGRSPTSKVLEKYWKKNTDALTFDEFCDICRREPATCEDDLIRAFRRIDVNGDGYVSNSELRKVLTTRGEKMTVAEVQKIIDDVDQNGDGKLDYREFAQMIIKTQMDCKAVAHRNLEKKLGTAAAKTPTSPRATRTSYPINVKVVKNDDSDSDDDIVIGTSRSTINSSSKRDEPTKVTAKGAAHDVREWSKPGLTKQASLVKPRTLREWKMARSKGCFFFNDRDKIISHQYSLRTTQDTSVWITIEPLSMMNGDINSKCEAAGFPVDMILLVLDSDEGLVAFSEQRDVRGKYALSCDLKKGSYKVLAFTSGCRFRQRVAEPSHAAELVVRKKDGHVTLTKEFKDALRKVFDMADLSDKETLSRDDFQLFQLHTSGQELDESLWQVVEEKIELVNDCITWQGYLQLTQLEAEDLDEDDDEDLWVTLTSMGFNKELVLDQASPFVIEVYAERCAPNLKATKIDEGGKAMSTALATMVKRKGEESRVRGSKDLFLHSYVTDYRMSLVIENRSTTKQRVEIDCRKSENVTSSQPSGLSHTVEVPAKSSAVAHHLLPKKDFHSWSVACADTVK